MSNCNQCIVQQETEMTDKEMEQIHMHVYTLYVDTYNNVHMHVHPET